MMFINFSNHPSSFWSEHQKEEASRYGQITDLPFPVVSPEADEITIEAMAEEYTKRISQICHPSQPNDVIVHAMGEMTLCYRVVKKLIQLGFTCVASTTERISQEFPNGEKTSLFTFVRFRKY